MTPGLKVRKCAIQAASGFIIYEVFWFDQLIGEFSHYLFKNEYMVIEKVSDDTHMIYKPKTLEEAAEKLFEITLRNF